MSSPYARYGKRPHRYSTTYRALHKTLCIDQARGCKPDQDLAVQLRDDHARQFGYRLPRQKRSEERQ